MLVKYPIFQSSNALIITLLVFLLALELVVFKWLYSLLHFICTVHYGGNDLLWLLIAEHIDAGLILFPFFGEKISIVVHPFQ